MRTVLLTCLLAQTPGTGFEPLLVGAADANRDGKTTAVEWTAFVDAVAPTDPVDADAVKVAILRHLLDANTDGTLMRDDVDATFAAMDADGNGALAADETGLGGGSRAGARRRGFANRLARGVLAQAADADASGDVTGEEWSTLVAAVTAEAVPDEVLRGWMQTAERAPGGRTAFTPGIFMMTVGSSLDVDKSGDVSRADLTSAFASLDTSGDGDVDASELVVRPSGGGPAPQAGPPIDRSQPPLMPWQRNLDDALALAKATGKPLLVCVNMDGEAASESLAWGRYRDPEFAKLAQGFVCVLASPDRRNVRDHDDRGRRITDTRFGTVVNAEHIDIEPKLFARYFSDRRVAPRHVGVSPGGKILFDIYLTNELSLIDAALREHGTPDVEVGVPATEAERLASPASEHRTQLESAFLAGDEATRARLASLALSALRDTQHPELLRLALHDPEPAIVRQGLWTLIQHIEVAPVEMLPRAAYLAGAEPRLRGALVAALADRAETDRDALRRVRVQRLARVFEALHTGSRAIDAERWKLVLAVSSVGPAAPPSPAGVDALTEQMARIEERLATRPGDGQLNLLMAAATMNLARIRLFEGLNPTFLLEDVRVSAKAALAGGIPNAEAAQAYVAWSSYLLGDLDEAAQYASEARSGLIADAGSTLAHAVLNVDADVRTRKLYEATPDTWTVEVLADTCAAHATLLAHPACTEGEAKRAIAFFGTIEAYAEQEAAIRGALERFPLSPDLHAQLRTQTLRDHGAAGLERIYGKVRIPEQHAATTEWFAGLAALVAAEHYVSNKRSVEALAAYQLSIDRFQTSVELSPSFEGSATHYTALDHAGRARLLTAARKWDEAQDSIRSALTANASAIQAEDGLGKSPAQSASELWNALVRAGEVDHAEVLGSMLNDLGIEIRPAR
ncbi:MAG: hypothetical protein GY711_34295 [bacterium]|nr:hypothetical protein [bacterium]